MSFEVFVMIVMALLSAAIFLLYRMITNDQRNYLSAFNNIGASLNSCMNALDSCMNVIESVVIPLKEKLDADSVELMQHEGDTDESREV